LSIIGVIRWRPVVQPTYGNSLGIITPLRKIIGTTERFNFKCERERPAERIIETMRKICSADKSWKSLDAASLDKLYANDEFGQILTSTDLESSPSLEAQALPPPAKFSNSRHKLMEKHDDDTSSPSTALSSSSSDTILTFPFAEDDCSDFAAVQEKFLCLAINAPQPSTLQKAELRKLQRKLNFVLGLQNEAERRRQGCCGW
jgi:hypothetical protein